MNIDKKWQPSASMAAIRLRAETYSKIRSFFCKRSVLEVETPLLSHTTVTDPHLHSLTTTDGDYLQTSPEVAMKRLLAANSGSIYQICKSFRKDESGSRHNPEFTMLEWYRIDFTLMQLMEELSALITKLTGINNIEYFTYAELFEKYIGINPHQASQQDLASITKQRIDFQGENEDKDTLLDLLLSHLIEPQLGQNGMTFVCEYPASQCAMARIKTNTNGTLVADRFELYLNGMELANGYHELSDPAEQQQRFNNDIAIRKQLALPQIQSNMMLIEALQNGLPNCSGVALGLDRLLMVMLNEPRIGATLAFTYDRA